LQRVPVEIDERIPVEVDTVITSFAEHTFNWPSYSGCFSRTCHRAEHALALARAIRRLRL
jgi:hypothetical protein